MLDFVNRLFDPTGFPPLRTSGEGWTPGLIWLHVTSDLFIWLAFLSIPLVLLYFTRRRDLPFPRLFVLFALFILACGNTHLVEAIIFDYPIYRFAGVLKFVTAVVSWVTVIALIPVIPRVMNVVTAAARPGDDTRLHRPLPAARPSRVREYIVAVLAGLLAVLVRSAIDPVVSGDQVFVLGLLAVVYVSWQFGFGPGMACLAVTFAGYLYFFMAPRGSFASTNLGAQLAAGLFFFCGVACAALGESQRVAQRRAKAALSSAVARQSELESEVVRRRAVEAALRQREAELVAAQRETAVALARLDAFLDNAPVGIAFFDPQLRYARINPALAAVNGKPVAEHVGRPLAEVLPDFPPDLIDAYRRTATDEGRSLTNLVRRPDVRRPGAWRAFQSTAFPVRDADGRTIGAGVFVQDETDRLRAEEELRRSERNLADFFENANVGLHWVNADGVIVRANKAELEMLGYRRDEYVDHPIDEFHASPEAICDILARLKRGERLDNYPARLRCKDGTTRDVLISSTVLWEDGRFVHTRCFTRDVTDLNLAAEALRESENRFRSMADSAPALIWLSDPAGRRTYFNRTWLEFTGRGPEEEGDAGWAAGVHPDDRDRYLAAYAAAVAGRRPFEFEYRLRRRDGAYRWVLARGTPRLTPSGRFEGFIGLCLDVTERRDAAEALRMSEERFRRLTEAVPQMVWTADPRGEVTFVNRRWEEYTGSRPGAPGGAGLWGGGAIHPDDVGEFRAAWAHTLAVGAEVFAHEFRLRRGADGAYRWMLAVAVPLSGTGGAVAEWVGTLTDIDDQKRHTQILEGLVRERTAELQRSNEELEKFAYVASHDLQEPLRKIQAFGDRLRTKCRDQLSDAGKEYVDRMNAAAARMRRLIDDLLTFSRVATHRRPPARVSLRRLVADVLSDLEERLAQTGGTVRVGPLPAVVADPTQMRQLFQNLLVNAVKFHRPGVAPVVDVEGEQVEPAAGGERVCRITVRDNGIGFDEKYRERIFDVFQRLHGRNEYEGTGVGLAICRKIVERHGGTIEAHGRGGEGATFVVTLPAEPEQPTEAKADDVRPEQAHHDPAGRR